MQIQWLTYAWSKNIFLRVILIVVNITDLGLANSTNRDLAEN